jgi:CBS domain containing-hemolysin-like protein
MNAGTTISGVLLLVGIALFVLAEFGLLNVRQTRLQSLAAAGNRRATLVLDALKERHSYVAGIQIGITLFGFALVLIVEPWLTAQIGSFVDFLPEKSIQVLSVFVIAFPLVIGCELAPKFLTKISAERVSLALIIPLRAWFWAVKPLVWLCHRLSKVIFNKAMSSDPPQRDALL